MFCFEVICQEHVVKLQNKVEKTNHVGAPGLVRQEKKKKKN